MDKFIANLSDQGIFMSLENDDKLKISFNGERLDNGVLNKIKVKKQELIDYLKNNGPINNYKSIPTIEVAESYKLSSAQFRLWILSQTEEGTIAYNIPGSLSLKQDIHVPSFVKALEATIDRHEVLRTVFKERENGELRQWVLDRGALDFEIDYKDLRQYSDKESLAASYISKDLSKAFDLENGPLFRAALLQVKDQECIFYFNIHHIISDGWSMSILSKDVFTFYQAFKNNLPAQLEALPIQYKDYVVWQQEELKGILLKKHKEYWLNQFKGELPVLEFGDKLRPQIKTYNGAIVSRKIDSSTSIHLKKILKKEQCTLYMGLLSIVNVLIYKYTELEDIIIGSPIAGRNHLDTYNQIGVYINTLVLRLKFKGKDPFNELLQKVKEVTLNAYGHQIYPYDEIINDLDLQSNLSRNPLFDIVVSLENTATVASNKKQQKGIENLKISEYTGKSEAISKFDLSFGFIEKEEEIFLNLEYNTDIFTDDLAKGIAMHFTQLVENLVENPILKINEVNYLNEKETKKILNNSYGNKTQDLVKDTVLDLFKERVKESPENVALLMDKEQLSYKALDNRSDKWASYMISRGVSKGDVVGLYMERSIDIITGILGVMKIGAAYLPIDIQQPLARTIHMASESESALLLSNVEEVPVELKERYTTISIAELDKHPETINECNYPLLDDIAYVIYTSGSTGNPKGVCNTHGGLLNRLIWMRDLLGLTQDSVLVQKTPYTFDVSVWELLMLTVTGSKLVIARPDGHKEPEYLQQLIAERNIHLIHFVPSMLRIFLDTVSPEKCKNLQQIICSGEALSSQIVEKCKSLLPWVKIFNFYGPTEAAIDVTAIDLTDIDSKTSEVSIGMPVANTQIYIVNSQDQLQPVGVQGELLIGGVQVARGYLNRKELTNEKFIQNPFDVNDKYKLYRTGDLAKWNNNGTIMFLGRIDDQVKLRGYRIELSEIEYHLNSIPEIAQSVVLLKEREGEKFLVGYYEGEQELKVKVLRDNLSKDLPDYMLPSYYVHMEKLPVNLSGKIAKKELPELSTLVREEYTGPSNKTEEVMVTIWQHVLGVEKVGIHDNFFQLGGDSIKTIQITNKCKQQGIVFKTKDLIESQTISGLLSNLDVDKVSILEEKGILEGEVSLHPIQKQFFSRGHEKADHFNQSVLFNISKAISKESLTHILSKLVETHDSLRLKYEDDHNTIYPKQFYGSVLPNLSEEEVIKLEDIPEICNTYQSDLSIYDGDLVRFVVLKTPEEELDDRLLIVVHHLAMDDVSWRILIEDFRYLLDNYVSNNKISLLNKGTSYRQWVSKLKDFSSVLEKEEYQYWKKIVSNYQEFPTDFAYEKEITFEQINSYQVSLSKTDTNELVYNVPNIYGTEINDILMSGLALALKDFTNTSKLIIALEGHGREAIFEDVDTNSTIGWFTSVYPVCLNLEDTDNLSFLISDIKDTLNAVPHKGLGYGVLRYLSSSEQIKEELSLDYEDIIFNYLGDVSSSFSSDNMSISLANETTGKSTSDKNFFGHKISFVLIVKDGSLQVNCKYDSKRFKATTIEKLVNRYISSLEEIVKITNEKSFKCVKSAGDYGLPQEITNAKLFNFINSPVHKGRIISDIYLLTPIQKGFSYHHFHDSESYITQVYFDIIGEFSKEKFNQSWEYLIQKHATLRTAFFMDALEQPVQCVYSKTSLPIEELDFSKISNENLDKKFNDFLLKDRSKGFSLSEDPLFRISLVHLDNDRIRMVFTNHHIILDGWSVAILQKEFLLCYMSLEEKSILPDLSIDNFGDYVRALNKKGNIEGSEYWEKYLSRINKPSHIPFINNETNRNLVFGNKKIDFTSDLDVDSYVRKHRITKNTLVQGIWSFLLSKYLGQDTVAFGNVISGRGISDNSDRKVGIYINTIPLCTTIDREIKMVDWLQELQNEHTKGREEYGHLSLSEIESKSVLKRGLFDTIMTVMNYPKTEVNSNLNSKLKIENSEGLEFTNYVISIKVFPLDNQLKFQLVYNDELVSDQVILMIKSHIINVLRSIVQGAEYVKDIIYLGDEEKIDLIKLSKGEELGYTGNKNLIAAFAQQVALNPDRIAVHCEDNSLNYSELDARSNQWASYMISRGVSKGDVVGLYMERSIDIITGILGVMKIGAVYLPIDIQQPLARTIHMASESESALLLSNVEEVPVELKERYTTISIAELDKHPETINECNYPLLDDIAYVIYTSGSTGNPKGVCNTHGGLLNRLIWMRDLLGLTQDSVLVQKTPYTFDVSVWELLMLTVTGSKLVIARPDGHKEPEYLQQLIAERNIHLIHFVPSMLRIFLDTVSPEKCKNLQQIICSGEALSSQIVEKCKSLLPWVKIFNFYGPTEAAIDVTAIDLTDIDSKTSEVSIGMPVANTQIYIVNSQDQLQPVGVQGELLIGGVQVARGYLNRKELTNEKFIQNPFDVNDKYKLYRTGDLAKWNNNGTIMFLGRMDDQVKLRGYRIELGEIAHVLKNNRVVDDAVVLLDGEGQEEKRLIAYLVPSKEKAYTVNQLINEEALDLDSKAEVYEMDNGVSMYFYNRSEAKILYTEIFENKTYYKHGIKVPKNATIIDIGANVGTFSIFSMITFEYPKIYAFEPVSPIFNLLKKNASLYKGDIKLFNIGISDKEEEVAFEYYPNTSTLSVRHSEYYNIREEVEQFVTNSQERDTQKLADDQMGELLEDRLVNEKHNCQLRTLSQVIREQDIQHIDLLKIDAENSEMDVINGIDAEDWSKIDQVIIEVYDKNGRLENIKKRLIDYGFKVSAFQSEALDKTKFYDVYCTREKEILEGVIYEDYTQDNWYGTKALVSSIREGLSEELLDYMIPSEIRLLEKIPLTTNGKLDRKALQSLERKQLRNQVDLFEPTNELEKRMAAIWQEVLRVERVGIHDNFYELGGDSIKAIQITNKCKQQGLIFQIKDLNGVPNNIRIVVKFRHRKSFSTRRKKRFRRRSFIASYTKAIF